MIKLQIAKNVFLPGAIICFLIFANIVQSNATEDYQYQILDTFSWQALDKGDLSLTGKTGVLSRMNLGDKPAIIRDGDSYGVKFTGNATAGYLLPMTFCFNPDYCYTVEMEFSPNWSSHEKNKLAALFTLGRTMNAGRINSLSMMFWCADALYFRLNPQNYSEGVQVICPRLRITKGTWHRVKATYSSTQLKTWLDGTLMGKAPVTEKFLWQANEPFFIGTEDVAYNPLDGVIRNFRLTVSKPKIVYELSFPAEKSIYIRRGPTTVNAIFPGNDGNKCMLNYRITDVDENILLKKEMPDLPAGYAHIEIPELKNGYYRIAVTVREKNGRAKLTHEKIFVILPEAYPSDFEADSAFGIQQSYGLRYVEGRWNDSRFRPENIRRDARVMSWAGAKWFRLWLPWEYIESKPGVYEWDMLDACVEILREYGFHIMACLYDTPMWASADPQKTSRTSLTWTVYRKWVPHDFPKWGKFVGAVAERYKDEINYYQIWNEPDTPGYFQPFPRPDLYVKLLRVACKSIKAANPNAKIVLGGFAGLPIEKTQPNAFSARDLYSFKPHAFYDVFDFHCYSVWGQKQRWDKMPLSIIKPLREFLKAEGEGHKPFWNSETSFCSGIPGSKNHFGSPNISYAEQAYRVQQLYTLSAACGVEKTFYFVLRAREIGLLERDGNPRPAYVAYATTARELRGYRFIREQSSNSLVRMLIFRNSHGDEKAVIWATEGEQALSFKIANDLESVEVRDLMGNKGFIKPIDGICTLKISESAIFVPDFKKIIPTASLMKVELPKFLVPGQMNTFNICWRNPYEKKLRLALEMSAQGWFVEPSRIRVEVPPGKDKKRSLRLIKKEGSAKPVNFVDLKITVNRPGTYSLPSENTYRLRVKKALDLSSGDKGEFFIGNSSQVVVGQELKDLQNRITQESQWKGIRDLSAQVSVLREGNRLSVTVQVTDDILFNDNLERGFYNGDCVEIFLDLRESAQRFTMPKTKGYYHIRVPAPVNPGLRGKYRVTGEVSLEGFIVKSNKTSVGYEVSVSLPLSLIKGNQDVIGFDVAVDDADGPGGRKTQLSWVSTAQGYADPTVLGILSLEK